MGKRGKAWETYEGVACYVLTRLQKRFHLAKVEGKQKVNGVLSKTTWEIDAKGVRDGDGAIILIECRRYKQSLPQEALAAIAYRIQDTGAKGGIIVSPLPLQKGAAKVAEANHIQQVQLTPESTRAQWIAKIEDVVHAGFTDSMCVGLVDSFKITVHDGDKNVLEQRTG